MADAGSSGNDTITTVFLTETSTQDSVRLSHDMEVQNDLSNEYVQRRWTSPTLRRLEAAHAEFEASSARRREFIDRMWANLDRLHRERSAPDKNVIRVDKNSL